MKIQIIGYSGSGKSTLAKELSEYLEIPLLYLDNVQFYDDWQEHSLEEQDATVVKFLNDHDSWVIDGNYTKVGVKRFEESDLTIFLNFNRFTCLISALKRYFKYHGKIRESCHCVERFNFDFFWWIIWEGRTKKRKQKHLSFLSKTKGEKVILKNRKQVKKFIQEFKQKYSKN